MTVWSGHKATARSSCRCVTSRLGHVSSTFSAAPTRRSSGRLSSVATAGDDSTPSRMYRKWYSSLVSMYAPPRRVLTVADVAEIAQVDPATIRRAVKSGDLAALRIAPGGRLLRFRPGDVAAWLEVAGPSSATRDGRIAVTRGARGAQARHRPPDPRVSRSGFPGVPRTPRRVVSRRRGGAPPVGAPSRGDAARSAARHRGRATRRPPPKASTVAAPRPAAQLDAPGACRAAPGRAAATAYPRTGR